MQNTLLVGLSRQVVLERQMDVVANNIANITTNGYKADRSLFQEFLRSGAHEDNFAPSDRRVSLSTTAPPSTTSRKDRRRRPRTRWTSRSTARASSWCRRPKASAIPATAI